MKTATLSYLDWIKHLPIHDSELAECTCLNCGSQGLHYQYFGIKNMDFGWKIVWCPQCNTGINISRTQLPKGETVLVDPIEQEHFSTQYKHLKLFS